ncbi:MAG: hypothetical protein HY092_02240 [Candidatus Kerfeldbacteria bacterium]|nr:hypothetical protein [Candidatus Kerfeldbacteria bacterium]
MLNGKRNGTYVEIGAQDAILINNTYLLESHFQWKGVSIDIDENSRSSFKTRGRKNSFVVNDALRVDYERLFRENGFGNHIDYLQLDIDPQSQTLACLKKLPLDRYRFSVITYETDFYDPSINVKESKRNRDESRAILLSHGYELVGGNIAILNRSDPFEDWYIDPQVIDKKIAALFPSSTEYNNKAESYILTQR